jgi:hypothetical protein
VTRNLIPDEVDHPVTKRNVLGTGCLCVVVAAIFALAWWLS